MKYLIIISFLFSNIHLFAQETKKVILKDTIHLKGYVKYLDGTPAKYIMVNSKEFYENIYSKTDENGYFEINPFKPSDTLIVDHHKFPINGSRFISLTIPKFEKKLETSLIITKRLKSEVPNQISIECKNTQSFNHRFSEYTASYPGGNDNFTESLKKNIKYPIAAIKSNIEGEVVIRFTVDSLGKVINPTIIKGIGYGCEKEVINQLSKLQKWHPAVNNNSRINQDFILTYIFKLED